ncbi:DUF4238 domain-containing protein [Mesorhizobium sp. ASY16-5R]|uniref:DUF4238 domain-containing protein n=1 Tax=Mesorhizobium sp. ASY16-5R TaxID=3445772 RepID=UPI003FA0BE87
MSHRRHHYIPQFYLRPWLGADHKLEEYGHVPPTGEIRSRRRGTKSTGYEDDLYSIPGATAETRQNIERIFMGTVDKTAADARDMLLRGVIPTGPERQAWARFLMSVVMRTPEEIRLMKEHYTSNLLATDPDLEAEYKALRRSDLPPTLGEYMTTLGAANLERSALVLAVDMMQLESVTKLFMSAQWCVLDIGDSRKKLMTSDHPVVMTNGLGRFDGHFAIAISPQRLFVGFMFAGFADRLQKERPEKVIRLFNDAVIGQGRKFVYGVDGRNLAKVRRLMGTREYMQFVSGRMKSAKIAA